MVDSERADSHRNPTGVPVTPQARKFGYEFPVYVSLAVWSELVLTDGIPSKRGTTVDLRIWEVLEASYEELLKQLAQLGDDEEAFLYYPFKAWYWSRHKPKAKKKVHKELGARLFINPDTDEPWLYLFDPEVDRE
jgi:hypothetical protein